MAVAKRAVKHHERLINSGFFDVYVIFEDFRKQKHHKIACWTDGDVGLIRQATEQYFWKLHDQRRGNEDCQFICNFAERGAHLGGRSTNTLAFVQIYGENSITKYNIKYVFFFIIQELFL